MKIVLDTSAACYLVIQNPRVGQVDAAAHMIRLVEEEVHSLFLPTSALAEVVAVVDTVRRPALIQQLTSIPLLEIVPFDTKAALVAAEITRRTGGRTPWQHVKVDAQIVATAFSLDADALCTMDGDHVALAARGPKKLIVGGPATFLRQMPLPAR